MQSSEAAALLADPQTPAQVLFEIAQQYPEFAGHISAHPNAYEELREWTANIAAAFDEQAEPTGQTPQTGQFTPDEALTNFYDELGLDRQAPIASLLSELHQQWLGFSPRASRAGDTGVQARQRLELIRSAQTVFADDASRESYDRALRQQPAAAQVDARIDWLGRGWSYYFAEDNGAAAVAARKAREQEATSPMPYVLSAWINLREGEVRRAKADADEAFVLDDLGDDSVDVQHVRGATFFNLQQFDQALQAFDRALARVKEPIEQAELLMRKTWAHERLGQHGEMWSCAFTALATGVELPTTMRIRLIEGLLRSVPLDRASCKHAHDSITGSTMSHDVKIELMEVLNLRFEYLDLQEELAKLQSVPQAAGSRPSLPFISMAITAITLLIGLQFHLMLVITLIAGAWVGFVFYRRHTWDQAQETYLSAQRRMAEAGARVQALHHQFSQNRALPPSSDR